MQFNADLFILARPLARAFLGEEQTKNEFEKIMNEMKWNGDEDDQDDDDDNNDDDDDEGQVTCAGNCTKLEYKER